MRRTTYFLTIILLGFFFTPAGNCQSPYQLKSTREIILSGASFGVSLPGYLLSQSKRKLTLDEISRLNREDVNRFDRSAIDYFSSSAKTTSDVLLYTSLASPLVLLLDQDIRENSLQTGIIYFETILFASIGVNLSKGLVRKPRPYTYNPAVPDGTKQKTDATNSFFSGHTTMTAAASFFTAKIFSDYNPGSKWKPAVWIGAAAIPLATGIYRYRAGQHFPTDVIIGYCWGALSGILIPELHRVKKITK